ncbi:hypothetical protein [Angustibacter luteus]|uniref:Uncharacterized protein n=1 Tax=Angustibacter luteus TaxID=658456 RepID=A0ABW1JDQ3_9ACTN
MEEMALDEAALDRLLRLSEAADPPPWTSIVEGRDPLSGDTFIRVGEGSARLGDLYLARDNGPADTSTCDLVAAARNALPALVAEVRRLRSQVNE